MYFKIYSTEKYEDYGINKDIVYMDNVKNVLQKCGLEFISIEESKEDYYLVNINSIEELVLLSKNLPNQQGLIVNGSELEIYNGYREL